MRLLMINANTSPAVTALCAAAARAAASPGTEIVPLTGAFGPLIIQSRAENAIAAHALLDGLAAHRTGIDAVLIAVSFDTALDAAREIAGCPVVGMTQASLLTAALIGERIGLVAFSSREMYRALAESYGMGARLAGIEIVDAHPSQAATDPDHIRRAALGGIQRLAEQGADVIVLCGAGFAGLAATLAPHAELPLLDGVACGVRLCEMLVASFLPPCAPHRGTGGVGLSAALDAALYPQVPK